MGRQFNNVNSSRGAPMGRHYWSQDGKQATERCHLFRVRMVDGDYDDGGAYWGGGTPLYCTRDNHGKVQLFTRAASRDAAKAAVLADYPLLRFYR